MSLFNYDLRSSKKKKKVNKMFSVINATAAICYLLFYCYLYYLLLSSEGNLIQIESRKGETVC